MSDKTIPEQMLDWAERLDKRFYLFSKDMLYNWLVKSAPKVAQLEAEIETLQRIGEDKVILNEQVHALEAENEALQRLADCSPWYAGMMPNTYYCIFCRGSVRFAISPPRDTVYGHKENCQFRALLTKDV